MRHLLLAGVMVLSATAAQAQTQQLAVPTTPINLVFLEVPLQDAMSFIARQAGITIEFDATVTEEARRAPLEKQPIRMNNASVEEAIGILTWTNGLTYKIIGPKAVRISKKS
jgi:hypothetical protein